ncbi:chemotaxis protein [Asaia spathodeae]|uniref:CheR family methyltransferase n=1 Tax=Asaia spathodeae TaxID=657016 RepID=UPI002FC3516F
MTNSITLSAPDYTDADFQLLQSIARTQAGICLPATKKALVYSRVSRRVREMQLSSFREYLAFTTSPAGTVEMEKLICALTTNVTGFFREVNHFDHLRTVVMPDLAPALRKGKRGRIWSAACSTGQEPWSIAMTVAGSFPEIGNYDFRILATDINSDVVARAASATYAPDELEGIPEKDKTSFLKLYDGAYRFSETLQRLPAFKVLNLNAAWPFQGSFSVIFCRNVVIYFDDETREALWKRLAERIEPGGFLYVGHSERVANAKQCGLVSIAPTIYQKEA